MTREELMINAPAVFAEEPVTEASDRYAFIPTTRLLDDFEKLGWSVERANQQKSKDTIHTKHEVFLRSPKHPAVNGSFPEIRLINSHNRLSSFNFFVGLYRLVCSNGLVVSDKVFDSLHIRHIGYDFEDLKDLTNAIVQNIPNIIKWMNKMQNTRMTRDEQIEFAWYAIASRFKEYVDPVNGMVNAQLIQSVIDVEDFLRPVREEDDSDSVWSVYNIVQEKLTKGGFQRVGVKDNISKSVRPIKNIKLDIDVNKSLWQLANNYL